MLSPHFRSLWGAFALALSLSVAGPATAETPHTTYHTQVRDVPSAEVHLLNTGHFALEEDTETIATLIRRFLAKKLAE